MVPTTKIGEMMASLDINDLDHPVLARPAGTEEEKGGSETDEAPAGSDEVLIQQNPDPSTDQHAEDMNFKNSTADGNSPRSDQDSGLGQDDVHSLPQVHALEPCPVQDSEPGADHTIASPQSFAEENQ
jgi:hypothetical protein